MTRFFLGFSVGCLVGIWQEEAIKRGFAENKNNQFKWKESK